MQPIQFSNQMLSDALTCSSQLYYAANPHCLTLLKVVKVSATEEGHQHSENFMGCTVYYSPNSLIPILYVPFSLVTSGGGK